MIYLDHNATTPVDPEVLEAMLPYFSERFANPASLHYKTAKEAEQAVDDAAMTIANCLHCSPGDLVFTSGATEAINLALKGAFASYRGRGRHMITVATEHRAVLDCCRYLAEYGVELTELGVGKDGSIVIEELKEHIRPDTFLVAVMWANNETGVIHPMKQIAELCYDQGILCFSDATQAVGKIPVDVSSVPVSMVTFSAHKFYGPKGIGGLYIKGTKPKVHIDPLIHGGGHQGGMRSGTLNVPGIIGMSKAIEIAQRDMDAESERLGKLRNRLEKGILDNHKTAFVNGNTKERLTHVTNICLPGVDSRRLIQHCANKLAFSSGSACTAADPQPSHVLQAMGLDIHAAAKSVRLSLGRGNDQKQVDKAIRILNEGIEEVGT